MARVATFQVTLAQPTTVVASVNYATIDDTAVAPTDYTARSGVLTFQPGETSKPVTVPVIASSSVQLDRRFYLRLSNPVKCTLATDVEGECIISTAPIEATGGTVVAIGDYAFGGNS